MAHKDVFAFALLFIVLIDTCDCGDIIAENIMEELANLKTALQHQISYTNRLETMISTQKQTIEILHGTIETLNDKFETLNGKMGELKSSTKEDHKGLITFILNCKTTHN